VGFYWLYALLLITNIAAPKAGIEVYGIPLTFGYMLLAAIAPIGLIGLARRPTLSWPFHASTASINDPGRLRRVIGSYSMSHFSSRCRRSC